MYGYIVETMDFYNYKISSYTNEIKEKSSDMQINFNFSEYIGHNYFEYFSLEIVWYGISKI
jgi:hypothetical protein